jgi:hypothetical protein
LLLVGTALRVWGAVSLPLEQDELYTLLESRDLFATTLKPGIDARPLYYLIQHQFLDVFPQTPLGLRLLPLAFALAGLWSTYVLARRVAGERAGLIALTLIVVSPWHLHISSFARYWSLIYFLTTLVLLALHQLRESDEMRPGWHWVALGACAAGLATHPTFGFALAGIVLGAHLEWTGSRLSIRWPSRAAWFRLWGPLALFVTVGVAVLVLGNRHEAVQNFGGRGLAASLRLLPAIVQWITPVQFAAGALGAFACVASPRLRSWGLPALLGAISLLALLGAAAFRTDTYADYGVALVALCTVSAAAALSSVGDDDRRGSALRAGVLLILLAGILPSTVSHLLDGMRFDYRPALAFAQSRAPDDAIIGQPEILMRYYAPQARHLPYRVRADSLDAALQREGRFWLVLSAREYGWSLVEPDTEAWTARHCRRVRSDSRMRLDSRQYRVELFSCGRDLPAPQRP